MTIATPDPGSFRDPGARVYMSDGAIYRAIMKQGAPAYLAAKDAGLYESLAEKGLLLPAREVAVNIDGAAFTLEHPAIPFISYPYEWSFAMHRAAALLHLDLHIEALKEGFTLSDATAYNVQFRGTQPVFIDHMSLRQYREGEIWAGHRQFCSQFLNPLLFWSRLRLTPNHWFRGSLEGIAPEELAPLLSFRDKFSWTVMAHVIAQAKLQRRHVGKDGDASVRLKTARLPKQALFGMLSGLRRYIAAMRPASQETVWAEYAGATSYSGVEQQAKRAFVEDMVRSTKPGLLFDLGCNTGDYSEAALDAGAGYVVGFDFDHATLDRAYDRFNRGRRPFLPLWMDAANPSPSQGWAQAERKGFGDRARADALVALAFVHHIAVGRNVPLAQVVDWLIGLAPAGVIEFPSKSDAMIQRMLALREDIFVDYTEAEFLAAVKSRARIVRSHHLPENGRLLVWFDRRP